MADDKSLFRYTQAKITLEEMQADPSHLVIKENYTIKDILKNKRMLKGASVIYSMWDGYLKGDSFWIDNGVPVIKIHCSGHAYKEDLVRLVEAVKPKQVIPNHTFHPNEFSNLFGEKALLLQDGQVLEF
jgi:ribonuclease J